ncbi:S8 family serine peptidase [Psychrosphaera sp.]|nr:S8 family serine peptidase [Psychrosphaera sp.]
MKLKLTALSLAMLPAMATASVEHKVENNNAYKADSVIVVYKDSASKLHRKSVRSQLGAKISDLNNDEVDDRYRNIMNGRVAQYSLKGLTVKEAIAKLNKNSSVLYAEPDYILHAAGTPDDERYSELWGMNNTGQTGGTADADIDAPEAWDISIGSRDVVIGVIDSGVDHTHPDLAANMWVNPGEIAGDGIDNDGNGYVDDVHGINAITGSGDPMDDNGHGTHVAGTIGATGNNGEGVVGVNHEVSIIGCKFLDASGSGSSSDALECVDYFVALKNNGVNVKATNNSWGGGGFSQAMFDGLTVSEEANILFLAAAGNDAYDNDATASYPSGYSLDSIVAVASTTHTDGMSSFSQWGLTTVDLGAPGSAILSTVPGGGYSSFSGTSMATPHVAGAAALAWSVNPELSAAEMKALLMNSGDDNAALLGKTVSGKRLNVHNALLDADPEPSFTLNVAPANQTVVAGETATYSFDVGSIADWDGVVSLTLDDSLGGAFLSTDTVTPGQSFVLSVPTTDETNWGDYSFTITATSGDIVKSKRVELYVEPQGLVDVTYSNNVSVDIPDNTPEGITSVISVADPLTVFGSSSYINITHTYIADLIITLTSPSGTAVVLHNSAGGSADDIDQSFATDAFNGEVATGDWTLSVSDNYAADVGTLNNWSMTISGLGEVLPAAPQADFSSEVSGLTVMFADMSSDANNDIVSWAWDFGDGSSSSEQNPAHTYADAGAYDVTLTVTDATGESDTFTASVTVSTDVITAEIKRAYLTRFGSLRVDFSYDGSTAEMVDVYRNGVLYDTVSNTGIYRDRERRATGTSFTYKVCNAGTPACSNEVTASF